VPVYNEGNSKDLKRDKEIRSRGGPIRAGSGLGGEKKIKEQTSSDKRGVERGGEVGGGKVATMARNWGWFKGNVLRSG